MHLSIIAVSPPNIAPIEKVPSSNEIGLLKPPMFIRSDGTISVIIRPSIMLSNIWIEYATKSSEINRIFIYGIFSNGFI